MKSILITGGAGFIGSSLAVMFREKYPEIQIFAFDNLRRRGSELNLGRLKNSGTLFIHGDIRNKEDYDALPHADFVIDAAAEPSIRAGFNSDREFVINTNLIGTINTLEYCVKHRSGMVFLSTSRVYPADQLMKINTTEDKTRFTILPEQELSGISREGIDENFPLRGFRSLYGATKLSSELLIREYTEFFGLQAVINRCGIVTGPWQLGKAEQGIIAYWMAHHYFKKPLRYTGFGGTGKQVRDILHINDLFELVEYELFHMDELNKKTFNAGGGRENSLSIRELTGYCSGLTGNRPEIDSDPADRPADIKIYISDNQKVTNLTGWKPKQGIEAILSDIFNWLKTEEKTARILFDPENKKR